jgi:hypothetical protein
MMGLTRGLQSLQKQVNVQTNIEIPSAALTLTRSATLAITTAGTVITWQTETRNNGFTWSGTDITIPTSGYYAINFAYTGNALHTSAVFMRIDGVAVTLMAASMAPAATANDFTAVRYMVTGAALAIRVIPTVNNTIVVNAENANGESPILHIVQLTGAV